MAEIDKTTLGKVRYSWQENEDNDKRDSPDKKSVVSETSRDPAASDIDSRVKTTSESDEDYLPLSIRNKDYSHLNPAEADKQLWEDLKTEHLSEEKFTKYICIDDKGKAFVDMPSKYHERVVTCLMNGFNAKSTPDDPLVATASAVMELEGSKKSPDVFIFGKERTEKEMGLNVWTFKEEMNPHVIIEVSWTNDIKTEFTKFALQINDHDRNKGIVNAGYLIKFIPASSLGFPTSDDPDRPIQGVDVYRMEAPQDEANAVSEPPIAFRWRYGQEFDETMDIKFTADELGHVCDVSYPLEWIVETLKSRCNVVFRLPEGEDE
ncbi:MAG: hypothetical protein SGILL_009458 [Bacillariaceae sp.]